MKNIELIEKLFTEGKITFAEAIQLGMQDKNPKTSRESIINQICDQCLEGFKCQEIVDFMHSVEWNWAYKEVNVSNFKEMASDLITETVNNMLDYVKAHNYTTLKDLSKIEKTFGAGTAGFQVSGYFDEDGSINVDLQFIADNGFACAEPEDILKIINN